MNVTAEKTDEGCERASEHAPPPHMPRSSAGEQTTDANAKAAQQASGQRAAEAPNPSQSQTSQRAGERLPSLCGALIGADGSFECPPIIIILCVSRKL